MQPHASDLAELAREFSTDFVGLDGAVLAATLAAVPALFAESVKAAVRRRPERPE